MLGDSLRNHPELLITLDKLEQFLNSQGYTFLTVKHFYQIFNHFFYY